jgi:[CysO sulfur-carrier protein]-S-L-cysteine hydrolase
MPSSPVSLAAELKEMMIRHALGEAPNECCGLLLGKGGTMERLVAMKSDPPAPDAYFMDPVQQVEVFTDMEKRGEQLLGIYHSHPKGPLQPSVADLQLAFHPEAVYFIISLAGEGSPEVRAFMLRNSGFDEVPLSIT